MLPSDKIIFVQADSYLPISIISVRDLCVMGRLINTNCLFRELIRRLIVKSPKDNFILQVIYQRRRNKGTVNSIKVINRGERVTRAKK